MTTDGRLAFVVSYRGGQPPEAFSLSSFKMWLCVIDFLISLWSAKIDKLAA